LTVKPETEKIETEEQENINSDNLETIPVVN
jgi:hypothetical protein